GRKIVEGVVGNLGVQEWVGGVTACDNDEGVSIRRRRHQRLRRNNPTCSRPIFNHDGLAPVPGDHVTQRAGEDVHSPTGGVAAEIMSRTKNHRAAREISMAAAEGQTSPKSLDEMASQEKPSSEKASSGKAWHDIVLQTLKRNDVRLVPYVPDRVLTRLIQDLHADPFFTTFPTAREEEAVGIVSGAWMGGMRAAVLMQSFGC